MSRFDRLATYAAILDTGLVPLFHHPRADTAIAVAGAVADGGARVLEFTNRGRGAVSVFAALAEHVAATDAPLALGVGSIIDAPTAAMFIDAGACFVVGPALVPEVARLCNRRKIAYLPGCDTVSEIAQAHELGAEIVKLFPASSPSFVRAVRGPMPWTRVMPTGGVDADNLAAWFAAGACAVGMGSKLISRDAVAAGDPRPIAQAVERTLRAIRACRP